MRGLFGLDRLVMLMAGAAGLAIGGSAAAAVTTAVTVHPPEFAPLTPRHAPGFDHIVVVMFENRSFDNVLGRLYTAIFP